MCCVTCKQAPTHPPLLSLCIAWRLAHPLYSKHTNTNQLELNEAERSLVPISLIINNFTLPPNTLINWQRCGVCACLCVCVFVCYGCVTTVLFRTTSASVDAQTCTDVLHTAFKIMWLLLTVVILVEAESYRYRGKEKEMSEIKSLLPCSHSFIFPSFAFPLSPPLHSPYIHPLLHLPSLYLCE